MDSRKSIGEESLRESLHFCTFIINVSHNFYEIHLFGFLQNLLGEIFARMDFQILAEFLALARSSLLNSGAHEQGLKLRLEPTTQPQKNTHI